MIALARRRAGAFICGALCIAGFALLQAAGHSTLVAVLGGILLGAALLGVIAAIMLRLGPQSSPDRQREALAREQFERTGRWPGED